MKTIVQISIFIALVLSSCSSNEPDRKELIEQQLGVELPSSYETLVNDYETLEIIPSEYQIIVKIGFDKKGYKKIEDQIVDIPYYNKLKKYLRNDNMLILDGQEEIDNYQNIKDSLSLRNYRGSWIKTPDGFVYIDILGPDNGEPVEAILKTKERTLMFKYMNI
jgi:hypothetical protein